MYPARVGKYQQRLSIFIAILLLVGEAASGAQADSPRNGPPRFEREILPILSVHCSKCHGEASPQAGLDLSSVASALKGGKSGPVIIKGAAEKSFLFQRVSAHTMPPPGTEKPLSSEQIRTIADWINRGGDIPSETGAVSERKVSRVSEKDRQFWAFRKPARPHIPKLKNNSRARTPIDSFILAKLEAGGLTFSPGAPKLTLLRRAYLDLTGLPPTSEEIDTFLADVRPDAYERVIDRLLDSPHYGERWGRHWLDVAGYTDEQGYVVDLASTTLYDGMWRYRDYVVDSLNRDKPYDQFITEQLAGDELVDWRTAAKLTREIREPLIATGYLRTISDLTDDLDRPMERYDVLFAVTENVSTGLLGLTLGCARCHDHKYDPIPQQDYYRFMSLFASAYNLEDWKQPKNRYLPDISKIEQDEAQLLNGKIDPALAESKKQLQDLLRPYEERLLQVRLASVPESLRPAATTAFTTPPEERDDVEKFLVDKLGSVLNVPEEELTRALVETDRQKRTELQGRITALQGRRRTFGKIQALWDVGKPPEVHLLRRGEIEAPGEAVEPGFLSVLSEEEQSEARRPAEAQGESSGRRLALARWLTSRNHPLTSRVMINRIWQHYFGKGIVATPDNFGLKGAAPTHPELLDWLSVDFMEQGWKMKRIHKMILTSTVYRQSSRQLASDQSKKAQAIDPSNELLWRMNLRRLEAEVVRDSLLAASGKLDRSLAGEPIPLTATPDGLVTVSDKYLASGGSWRRSLYLAARRNYPLTFLETFDFPVMATNCGQRLNSATPLQALALLNSEFVLERAADLAAWVKKQVSPTAATQNEIEMAYLLALARKPNTAETRFCEAHLKKRCQFYVQQKLSVEEAEHQALISLCHMLVSSNEFLYVE